MLKLIKNRKKYCLYKVKKYILNVIVLILIYRFFWKALFSILISSSFRLSLMVLDSLWDILYHHFYNNIGNLKEIIGFHKHFNKTSF